MILEDVLNERDRHLAVRILGQVREPDLVIAPDGNPYLYRWWVTPRSMEANVYLHLQVASDPERPLHDHPWSSQSVILSGGYEEIYTVHPPYTRVLRRTVAAGDVIPRTAAEAHRLILPSDVPYTMTLFSTGPVIRDWGFWLDRRTWRSHADCIINLDDGRSVFRNPLEV